MTPALDPVAVERFRRDCGKLLDSTPTRARPIGIAVSGGPDSMALVALAADAFPHAVTAATVDHRLRPEAAEEAAMVAAWCDARAIPHATLVADRVIAGSGVQAKARELRYRLLGAWAAQQSVVAVATGHHADDQAETFLMRAVRGVGLAGLRGVPMRSRIDGTQVVRPLLDWRRAELRGLVRSAAIPVADDPSNADIGYERVRVRELIAGTPWLDPAGLAASARHLAEIDVEVAAMRDLLWRERRVAGAAPGEIAIDVRGLPRDLCRRLARLAIETVRAASIEGQTFDSATNIEPLLDRLEGGEGATQAGVIVRPTGTVWRFAEAPPRRSS